MPRYLFHWSCLLLLIVGCAAQGSPDLPYLMEQDYRQMTDTELVAYEQALSDELLRHDRSSAGDMTIGFGLFSWGGSSGVGVNTGHRVGGGDREDVAELRQRREEVRVEMRERGLLP